MNCRKALAAFLFLLLLAGVDAAAPRTASPTDQVRGTTDKIISVLNDPALQGEDKRQERRRLIREELEKRFNWTHIARSSLGRHWSKFSSAQQKKFLELFKDFLERAYLDRIEPYYNELDRIDYPGERILEERFASVRAMITTRQNVSHPVEYRLEQSASGEWLVYDVVIEGVSLARNYRTQFDEIISRSSPQGLLDDLQARVAAN